MNIYGQKLNTDRKYMEYLFSLLLFGFNLLDYEIGINRIAFLAVSVVLFGLMFYFIQRKTRDFLCTCVCAMCHTWPISWINILGEPSEVLQLPWFYLTGALIVLNACVRIAKIKENRVNAFILGIFFTVVFVSVYPLLISPSLLAGIKEFIIISFFIILTFAAFVQSSSLDEEKRDHIIDAYIWTAVISCVAIIVQYVYYNIFGIGIFKYSVGSYMGNTMMSCNLLMEDTSCATIMLGSAIFYMLERVNINDRRIKHLAAILITVIGLALTTRRTSIISLVICFAVYIPLRYKGIMNKVKMMSVLSIMVAVMILSLLIVRPVDDFSQYLDSNGRFENYITSIRLFIRNPLGIGYDNGYLISMMKDIVPHNTILRWLNMCGFIFTLLMVILLVYFVRVAYNKKRNDDMWVLLYCLLAMNFIPDLLNGRFFVIPCMLVLLSPCAKKSGSEIEGLAKKQIRRAVNEKNTVLPARIKR